MSPSSSLWRDRHEAGLVLAGLLRGIEGPRPWHAVAWPACGHL